MSNISNIRNRRNTNNLEKGLFYYDSDFDILIDDNEGYCYKLYHSIGKGKILLLYSTY